MTMNLALRNWLIASLAIGMLAVIGAVSFNYAVLDEPTILTPEKADAHRGAKPLIGEGIPNN
jgi:hypothetical protein